MATQNPKTLKEKNRQGLHPASVMSPDDPAISQCVYVGFTNPGQSTFDRKAEEMKAFLKRNPVPKEFLR